MNDVIEHFNKKEILDLLGLINNKLTKNGKIILKTLNSANPILSSSSRYINFTHETGFTEESFAQVLKISGFKDCKVFAPDIYIFNNNPINFLAKTASKILNLLFQQLFKLYGRKTTKIYTKNLIAVATKK